MLTYDPNMCYYFICFLMLKYYGTFTYIIQYDHLNEHLNLNLRHSICGNFKCPRNVGAALLTRDHCTANLRSGIHLLTFN